jgi:ribonuclease HI
MKGWVTINTDASFHHVHRVASFAFWIRHDQGRIKQAGPLKDCPNSLEAEIRAIGNAMYALLYSKFTDIDYIRVNTDCKFAIQAILGVKKHSASKETLRAVRDIMDKLRKRYKRKIKKRKFPFIDFHWVPAHTGNTETQKSWLNDWCDVNAKKHLREQILIKQNDNSTSS